jgi:hypothetical protein
VDALLALIFVVALIVSGVALFATLWVGSLALLVRPQAVAERVVYRFWPERRARQTPLASYRATGGAGLAFALIISWLVALEIIR